MNRLRRDAVALFVCLVAFSAFAAPASAEVITTSRTPIELVGVTGIGPVWSVLTRSGRENIWYRNAAGVPVGIYTAPKRYIVETIDGGGGQLAVQLATLDKRKRLKRLIVTVPLSGAAASTIATSLYSTAADCGSAATLLDVADDGTVAWEFATRDSADCSGTDNVFTVFTLPPGGVATELNRVEDDSTGDFATAAGGKVDAQRVLVWGSKFARVIGRQDANQISATKLPNAQVFVSADLDASGRLLASVLTGSPAKLTGSLAVSVWPTTDFSLPPTVVATGKSTKKVVRLIAAGFCGERILTTSARLTTRAVKVSRAFPIFSNAGAAVSMLIAAGSGWAVDVSTCDGSTVYMVEHHRTAGWRVASYPLP